jgi:hypothetical protein
MRFVRKHRVVQILGRNHFALDESKVWFLLQWLEVFPDMYGMPYRILVVIIDGWV